MGTFVLGGIVGGFFGFLTCVFIAAESEHTLKIKAIAYNCADYVMVDTLTGATQFKWKAEQK